MPDVRENQLKGGKVYFGLWVQRFRSMGTRPCGFSHGDPEFHDSSVWWRRPAYVVVARRQGGRAGSRCPLLGIPSVTPTRLCSAGSFTPLQLCKPVSRLVTHRHQGTLGLTVAFCSSSTFYSFGSSFSWRKPHCVGHKRESIILKDGDSRVGRESQGLPTQSFMFSILDYCNIHVFLKTTPRKDFKGVT